MRLKNKFLVICFILFLIFSFKSVRATGEIISYDGIKTIMPEIILDTDLEGLNLEDPEALTLLSAINLKSIIANASNRIGMEIYCEELVYISFQLL